MVDLGLLEMVPVPSSIRFPDNFSHLSFLGRQSMHVSIGGKLGTISSPSVLHCAAIVVL
jgi:hypothetical protein